MGNENKIFLITEVCFGLIFSDFLVDTDGVGSLELFAVDEDELNSVELFIESASRPKKWREFWSTLDYITVAI